MSVPGNSCSRNTSITAGGCLFTLSDTCIYYSGSNLTGSGINTGDNLDVVINKLNTFISTGQGTVTSVGLSMPSAFIVSGSPITSSGTFTVTGGGNTTQYIKGDGTLATLDDQFLGEIYNKSSWTNLSDFTNAGSTVSVVSNKLQFSGGANTYTQTLGITPPTCIEYWKIDALVSVDQITSTSYGFGVGVNSINPTTSFNAVGKVGYTTGGNTMLLDASFNTTHTTLASAAPPSVVAGNIVEISVERSGNILSMRVRNATTNTNPVSISYTYSLTPSNIVLPNTGRFSISSFGGQFTVQSINVTSKELKNAGLMIIGDSITTGYQAGVFENRFASLLTSDFKVTVHAGPSDRTVEVLEAMSEIIALKPKQALICIGSNDPRTGISLPQYEANYASISSQLIAAGVDVFYALPFYETAEDLTPQKTYIQATYPANKIINTWDPLLIGGSNSGDGIHPSTQGHLEIYTAIIDSYLLNSRDKQQDVVGTNGVSYTANRSVVLGQDVGQPGAPAALINNREIPLGGFNLGTSGTGTVVIGGSITNQTPPTSSIAVFFGDSITLGINASPASQRWSTLFCNIYGLTESNLAISGTYLENQSPIQSQNMVSRITSIPTKTSSHRWLVFAYGINDVRLNAPNYTTANYISDYTTVLNAAITAGWAASNIILVAPSWVNPTSYTSVLGFPVANQARHLAFITATQTVATNFGTFFANPYPIMAAEGADLLISATDLLHPNNGGYRVIASVVASAVRQAYTNGQDLIVSGVSEFSQIVLDNLAALGTPQSVLGQDGAGNIAPTNYIVGNQARINDQIVIGNGDYSPVIGESTAIYGGSVTGYIRVAGPIPSPGIGECITIGLSSVSGPHAFIDAFNDNTATAYTMHLNWRGGNINLGGAGGLTDNSRVYSSGSHSVGGWFRVNATDASTVFSSGTGTEIFFLNGVGYILPFERGVQAYPLALNYTGGQPVMVATNSPNGGTTLLQVNGGIYANSNIGVGETTPTALLHLKAGTATAGTAPIKLTAGTLLTTPELGALEFTDDGTTGHLYITLHQGGVLTRVQII